MAGEHAPVVVGGVGVGVEVDDADAAAARAPAATALAAGQVIEWSPPRMIGMAPVAATSSTLRKIIAWPRSSAGGHDVGVAGIDDVEHLERLDAELQRVAALGVVAWRMARGPKRAPGR